jgi:hypothetical protein
MNLAASLLPVCALGALWFAGASAAWSADPAAARVVALSGQVQSGARALKVGDTVAEGEELRSGVEGRATLEFADGSVLRVRTDSRLRIETHRSEGAPALFETRLRLESGAVEASVPIAGGPRFAVDSPMANLVARGTQFRARARPEAMLVEVVAGSVTVRGAAGGEVTVDSGYGTQVKPAEAPLAPVKLLDPPDISGIAELHETPVVRLRFAPVPGAVRYRIVLGTDRDLREVIVESRQRRPDIRLLELDDGEYFYAVRAIDALNLDGLEARGRLRLKMLPFPPDEAREPAPGGGEGPLREPQVTTLRAR